MQLRKVVKSVGNKWLKKNKKIRDSQYRLFCIPYAGAGAGVFRNWQQYFDEGIEVCPIQLPGRENRINEFLIDDVRLLALMMFSGLKKYFDKPFSIIGYSAGGVLAYELTILLKERMGVVPDFLFMGATTLDFRYQSEKVNQLKETDFIKYILKSGGTEAKLLEDEEFRKIFFPIIRNDYKMVEDYECCEKRLECPIRAYASKQDDEVPYQETLKLQNYSDDFIIRYLEGNHFFISSQEELLCNNINNEISSKMNLY